VTLTERGDGKVRTADRPLRIGITIGMRDEVESLWINGIKQNALYLAKLFQHSPRGHEVLLVNTTNVSLAHVPWDTTQFPVCTFDEAKDRLDVLIELGGQIGEDATRYIHERGTKLVSYCCGPEYVQNIEAMIFGRQLYRNLFVNQKYDAVWAIPQVMELNAGFFRTLRRRPVREVPFVWDPVCLEQRCQMLAEKGEYRAGRSAKRVAVMEPNVDVLKFSLYPLFIAELAYRVMPEKIEYVHVTNSDHLARENPEFIGVANHLDLVREHKVSFIGRHDTPAFLSEYTDIVVSHQWGLPLNYFYFDVCWNGYPLVHNASLCPELGYFYSGNDLDAGALCVVDALTNHDENAQSYMRRQRELIGRFLATNQTLAMQYDRLLYGLFAPAL
jgi:hypothetical protein